jgi:hypothetical protein
MVFVAALLMCGGKQAVAQDSGAAAGQSQAGEQQQGADQLPPIPPPPALTNAPIRKFTPFASDAEIEAALREVSPQHVREAIEKLVSFGTRNTNGSTRPEQAAQGKGIVAAREWIKSEFERYSQECGGCLEVKTDTFIQQPLGDRRRDRIKGPTEIQNVYAVLLGTDPDAAKRIYLVTGHYDSFVAKQMFDLDVPAPGANDDASGTAVSIECARVLSKHKFPATLIFLTVAGEEQGLLGSKHFAEMAKKEGWQIAGVLNNDIVGGNRTPGETVQNSKVVRVYSEGMPYVAATNPMEVRAIRSAGYESDSTSRELARYIRETGSAYRKSLNKGKFGPLLEFRADRFGRGGDHTSFNQSGFAAVRFTEFREDFHHQHEAVRTEKGIEYGDLPKFVDFDYVANVAIVNAATLASLASAPAPPAEVKIRGYSNDNNSSFVWQAAPGAKDVAYEVVWRATTAADWEHVVNVGNVTEITVPESKDNVVFGVRAVDARGRKSVVVIPQPQRRPGAPPPLPE